MRKFTRLTSAIAIASLASTGVALSSTSQVQAAGTKTLVIASDLPLDPSDLDSSNSTNNAIALYLKQINYTAGKFKVALKLYNNATDTSSGWDPVQCALNAQSHVANKSEVAVMGPFNSGCAKLEVPILNQAPKGATLIVSNANTSPGLTKPSHEGEPDIYYPTGVRNYARVSTTDDQQGAADAEFLKSKGVKSVYVLNDGQTYGQGVAQSFTAKAKAIGLKVLSTGSVGESWDPNQADYTDIFKKIAPLAPEAIFAAGSYINNGATLIKNKVAILGDNTKVKFMAPDSFTGYSAFVNSPDAQGAYLSIAGISNNLLTKNQPNGVASKFLASYVKAYGNPPVGAYSLYGVAAVQVILAAIAKSDGTRASITKAVFTGVGITIPASQSILGKAIHISTGQAPGGVAAGDSTAIDITIEQVINSQETTLQAWTVQ